MSFVVRQITDVQNIYRIDGNRCESNVLCVCKIRLLSQLLAEEIMFLLNLTDGHSNYRVALLLNNIFSVRLIGFFDEIGNRKVRLCVAKIQICKNGSVMKKKHLVSKLRLDLRWIFFIYNKEIIWGKESMGNMLKV